MSLKKAIGQMYDWVTHVWSPIVGCPHQCTYCYVRSHGHDQPKEIKVVHLHPWPALGSGRVIFVAHLSDLFAETVPRELVCSVLTHCSRYPENRYIFQTKNPYRMIYFLDRMPPDCILGTTIETNRQETLDVLSQAPDVWFRASCMQEIQCEKFLTIEPIMDFDLEPFVELILMAKPAFVNIGADSKGHHLPEPSRAKVLELIGRLQELGITIRKKSNLERLTG